jgi:hypothetical protein
MPLLRPALALLCGTGAIVPRGPAPGHITEGPSDGVVAQSRSTTYLLPHDSSRQLAFAVPWFGLSLLDIDFKKSAQRVADGSTRGIGFYIDVMSVSSSPPPWRATRGGPQEFG